MTMLYIDNLATGILKSLSLKLGRNECLALGGSSGSGKTTLLNAIAGNCGYQGNIYINGQKIDHLPSWRRPCRYLNQRLYLFPHLTLLQNLRLACYATKQPWSTNKGLSLLAQTGIEHLACRCPWQVSGGEQQRAALARVLITRPALLMLDEPFSSLDWGTRRGLWTLFDSLRKRHAMTTLLVTHEPEEARALGDTVCYLHQGQLSYGS